jgi:hypothetical protein
MWEAITISWGELACLRGQHVVLDTPGRSVVPNRVRWLIKMVGIYSSKDFWQMQKQERYRIPNGNRNSDTGSNERRRPTNQVGSRLQRSNTRPGIDRNLPIFLLMFYCKWGLSNQAETRLVEVCCIPTCIRQHNQVSAYASF